METCIFTGYQFQNNVHAWSKITMLLTVRPVPSASAKVLASAYVTNQFMYFKLSYLTVCIEVLKCCTYRLQLENDVSIGIIGVYRPLSTDKTVFIERFHSLIIRNLSASEQIVVVAV